MRSRILTLALTVTALTGFGVVTAPTASADGKIEYSYAAPEVSEEGDHVTWTWTLTNTGDKAVDQVVLVHRLKPTLPVTRVSAPCEVTGETVQCAYGSIAPGQTVDGVVEADLPSDLSGSPEITGRVTWQGAPATAS